ncbi:MAG: hypothetical protein Rhims3KO_06110 [Hyphomicrobiales bacterium]
MLGRNWIAPRRQNKKLPRMCRTIGKGVADARRFSGAIAGPPANSSTRNKPPKVGMNE